MEKISISILIRREEEKKRGGRKKILSKAEEYLALFFFIFFFKAFGLYKREILTSNGCMLGYSSDTSPNVTCSDSLCLIHIMESGSWLSSISWFLHLMVPPPHHPQVIGHHGMLCQLLYPYPGILFWGFCLSFSVHI